jgi:hypothetical protein
VDLENVPFHSGLISKVMKAKKSADFKRRRVFMSTQVVEHQLEAGTDAPSLDKNSTLAQVSQGSPKPPSSMDAFELDSYLRERARHHALEIAKDMSYIAEMHKLLSAMGARHDINKRLVSKDGRTWQLGWQAWAKSYGAEIGKSLSTIKRELAR